MKVLDELLADVREAREGMLRTVGGLTPAQAAWKPSSEEWSVAENLEHLVLAEHGGIQKIWAAAEQAPAAAGSPNAGLTIEEVVDRTWKKKEIAPPYATPLREAPFSYWMTAFEMTQPVLDRLGRRLQGLDLAKVVYPHFLCGPLDARQRLEFLRFHIERHRGQVERILAAVAGE